MKRAALGVTLGTVALVAAALLWGPLATPAPLPLRIGIQPGEASTPLFVADERGFFAENGLAVTMCPYTLGDQAIAAADAGEVEVALTTEYPVVLAALANRTVGAIACIDRDETTSVIGRADRGVATVADLRGKRVGVTPRTNGEFYLGRLLDLHGLDPGDVTVVDVPRPQTAEAVVNGSVDAIVTATREVGPITARLGGNATVVSAHAGQPAYVLLACDAGWPAAHPDESGRLLAALAKANEYIAANPADARAIAGRRANLSEETVAAVWPNHQFGLSLDRSLLTAMQDEARWATATSLTPATDVQELRDCIDTTAIARVRPGALGL